MNFTGFNTSTLGYKLISGKLREKRKHSEQLNKYVAGLIDADGWASFSFPEWDGKYYCHVVVGIKQAASNDDDFTVLRSLQSYFNLGRIYYQVSERDERSSTASWMLSSKDSAALYNRVGKHLRVKATHLSNLLWVRKELEGFRITREQREELRAFSKCSRKNSKWLKHPKHPSWSWLAGYLDGDGCYQYKERKRGRYGKVYNETQLCVSANAYIDDIHLLNFLKKAFKGSIYNYDNDVYEWRRNLGKMNELFALPFLKKMRKYSCLKKKYLQIDAMIKYHEYNRQQRLNNKRAMSLSDSPN